MVVSKIATAHVYLDNFGKSQGFLFSAYPKCFLINFYQGSGQFSPASMSTTMNMFS